jgi:hypothetical protein
MAVQQQKSPQVRYVDLPDVRETFSDSIQATVWDGQTLRLEFCVTRFPDGSPEGAKEAQRYPACRLVLSSAVAVDLFNRLQQTMAALAQAGVVSQQKPQTPPAGTPAAAGTGTTQ